MFPNDAKIGSHVDYESSYGDIFYSIPIIPSDMILIVLIRSLSYF